MTPKTRVGGRIRVRRGQAGDSRRKSCSGLPPPALHSPRPQPPATHQAPELRGAPHPLTWALALATCSGLMGHSLCPRRQREQMQVPCRSQKNSKSLLCCGHLRCFRSRRGGQSWWSRKAGLSRCGRRCSEQKEAVQVRQVCTAGARRQLSQQIWGACAPRPAASSSASSSSAAPSPARPRSCSTTRQSTVFFCSPGRPAKVARHCGQLKLADSPAQQSSRQEEQKLCPQGTVTGLLKRQRQMEQVSSSSRATRPGSDGDRAGPAITPPPPSPRPRLPLPRSSRNETGAAAFRESTRPVPAPAGGAAAPQTPPPPGPPPGPTRPGLAPASAHRDRDRDAAGPAAFSPRRPPRGRLSPGAAG